MEITCHCAYCMCVLHPYIIMLYTVYVLKFQTLFSFCSQIKCWFSGLEFTKWLSEYQTGKTLIRLLLQKQSDLGLHCFNFCLGVFQATSVRNFRTCTVHFTPKLRQPNGSVVVCLTRDRGAVGFSLTGTTVLCP